jgi:putative transposase
MEAPEVKDFYAASELAKLPGLPGSAFGVQKKAEREGYASRKVKSSKGGRGGEVTEYAFKSLPQETRNFLLGTDLTKNLPVVAPSGALVPAQDQPRKEQELRGWQRETRDARLSLVRECQRLAQVAGTEAAVAKMIELAAQGKLSEHLQALVPAANARSGSGGGKRTLSRPTLYRWLQLAKKGVNELAPKATEKKIPAWAPHLMKCWGKGQQPKLTEALEELATMLPEHIALPSYSQADHFIKGLTEPQRQKGRLTGVAADKIKPFRRRDTSHMYPGDAYTADGHCFDAEVAHPFSGRPFRPEITPVIDISTRMVVGWSCDLAESGLAVLDALRVACETYGPPAIFYTDNGPGFKNEMMTAFGRGILDRLSIHPEYSRPRNPKAHGVSERAHQTIMVKAARELCTYIGATMDPDTKKLVYQTTRKQIKGETPEIPRLLIEWEDFINHVNDAIERYNRRPHRGLPTYRDPETGNRVHFSPVQMWQIGLERMRADVPEFEWLAPANELADLYHPMVERKVDRGEVTLGLKSNGLPKRYYNRALADLAPGTRVNVAFSPSDPSRVWVRDTEDGRLLAVAELEANSSPYFAPSFIEEKRQQRAKGRMKRLERKAEDIRLELTGSAAPIDITPKPLEIELSPEVLETEKKIASLDAKRAERRYFANQWEIYEFVLDKAREGRISTAERQWQRDYEDWQDTGKKGGMLLTDPFLTQAWKAQENALT